MFVEDVSMVSIQMMSQTNFSFRCISTSPVCRSFQNHPPEHMIEEAVFLNIRNIQGASIGLKGII